MPTFPHTLQSHEVEDLINDIEDAASGISRDVSRRATFDAVVTNHTNTDHTNKGHTLAARPFRPNFTPPLPLRKMIESWEHFDHVHTTPSFGKDDVGGLAQPRLINYGSEGTRERMERGLSLGL